jgi:betaine-aldehyde dehydrogenase
MTVVSKFKIPPRVAEVLPTARSLFYGGAWHEPENRASYADTYNPATGEAIASVAQASAKDTEAAIEAAHTAFPAWRDTHPEHRTALLRKGAAIIRAHARELAMLDSGNTGNPVVEMTPDAIVAADALDYFAGLIPMIKGETIPQASDGFHYTLREPLGVVARIVAYNHPVMFAGEKLAAPLAAGNCVIIKPAEQAPLSALRLAELLADVFPPGVLSFVPGGRDCGVTLSTHPLVKMVTLIGSVPTGKAISKGASDTLKPVLLELGGKNALVAYPDADIDKLVDGMTRGMNFMWAGQSCGSTSRVFLHESLHNKVLVKVAERVKNAYVAGDPTDDATTMGPLISKVALDRVMGFVKDAKAEGARLVIGGQQPPNMPEGGFFYEPTIFADLNPSMRLAREEVFGPIMGVFKWSNEEEMWRIVNDTNYGLTASVYTNDLSTAQKAIKRFEVGYVWVNNVARHYLNMPFGGQKNSGLGREECFDEMISFTQLKSVNVAI